MALGIECVVYCNTGSYNAPTWRNENLISDFAVTPEFDRQEAITRQTKVKRGVSTLAALQFSGKMLVVPANPIYQAWLAAFIGQTPLDLLILSGLLDANYSEGFRLEYDVIKFGDDQNPGTLRYRDFTIDPALSENMPQRATVSGGVLSYAEFGAVS